MTNTTKTVLVCTVAGIVLVTSTTRHEVMNQHLPTAAAGQAAMTANSSISASTTVLNTTIDVEHAVEKVDPLQTIG